jgi:hypothetical protein
MSASDSRSEGEVVAVLAPAGHRLAGGAPHAPGLLGKLSRISEYRRNPRSPEYMRAVVAEVFPIAQVVELAGDIPPREALARASSIVLLWPDAIGYGWSRVERAVFRSKRRGARVLAVTGRRRTLELTPSTLLSLRARRMAERLWLGEAALAVALLASAPFLVVWDFARGHR